MQTKQHYLSLFPELQELGYSQLIEELENNQKKTTTIAWLLTLWDEDSDLEFAENLVQLPPFELDDLEWEEEMKLLEQASLLNKNNPNFKQTIDQSNQETQGLGEITTTTITKSTGL
ncbi:MAG TPA: hypothetical protein DCF68_02790 [Cyanothece sp. UBA12306]|nr:hypothetical protein [Cyanothece sp. UBA12306]